MVRRHGRYWKRERDARASGNPPRQNFARYQMVPKSLTGEWGWGCKLTASAGAPSSLPLDALAGAATPVGVPAQHPRWKRHTTTPALSPWAATKQRPLWLVFTRRAAPSGVSGLMAPRADRPVVLYR